MSEFTSELDGAVLVVTLDHQDRGNALSGDAAASLADVIDDVSVGPAMCALSSSEPPASTSAPGPT